MAMFPRLRVWQRARRYAKRVDPAEIAWMRSILKPGQTALDVGAHKGAYAWWMKRSVGPRGRVVCFEPQPALRPYLKPLEKAWTGFRYEWLALSSKEGELPLTKPKGKPTGVATLEQRESGDGFETVLVPVTTLDLYDLANGIGPVSFIKVDVEGHELEFFRGAETVLRRDRPILLFECEARHRADGIQPVFDWLLSLGYRGQFFHGHELRPLAEFDVAKHQVQGRDPYCNNFVFTHAGGSA